MTVEARRRRISPRLFVLAASVAWRHAAEDPAHAVVLAWRVLPAPARRVMRRVSRYGRALTLWERGDREAAVAALGRWPKRQASFALAMDRPDAARAALGERMPPTLAARLAWREGRLADAVALLDGTRSRRAVKLRRAVAGELAVLTGAWRAPPHLHPAASPVPGRVLHIVTNALPTTHAGYTVRTHQIVLAQRAAGLDPHVVTRCGFPVAQGVPDARLQASVDGIAYHRLLPYLLPATADAGLARGTELAARLARRVRPAVLHAATNHVNGQLALALRERCGLPVVYEVRGFLEETWLSRHNPAAAASDMYRASRAMETRCMRAADLVVTLGEVMRAEIVSRGVAAAKVIVVPNAVDAEFLRPLPDGRGLRAALGIAPRDFVLGMVSSLFGYEGGGTLLRAAAELRRRDVPARPLIVGDGPERAALERLARQLVLDGLAVFTGRVPNADVRHYHAVLDVFVVPRTGDRVCQLVTPLKPVEAMASGLCVVASEVKALREIIEPGITGTLTVPEDPMTLADCLEDLFYSPGRRRDMGASARDWVARHRTWARNAERYVAAYESIGAV